MFLCCVTLAAHYLPQFKNLPLWVTVELVKELHSQHSQQSLLAYDQKIDLTVINGSGSGQYEYGEDVVIKANSPGDAMMEGQIAEVLIFDYALTPTEIDDIETYLMDKWYFELDTTSMEVHYDFNEGTGATITDIAPEGDKADTGTLRNGALWATTEGNNGAIYVDGVDDYISVPDSTDINVSDTPEMERTISVWFKVVDKDINTRKQVIWEEGGNVRGTNVYIYDGKLYAGGWNEKENGWNGTWISTDTIENDTWHHVMFVLDVPDTSIVHANSYLMYLDGEFIAQGDAAALYKHSGNIGFGAQADSHKFHDGDENGSSGENAFNGWFDEFRLFNRALSADEIRAIYRKDGL